ncbi:MAG: hypothetical protein ACRC3H_21700 [Lachnospiraceae bacterium]
MAKVTSDNTICSCSNSSKWGFPKVKCRNGYGLSTLNIRHGNTASVVVCDGNADYMAKGGSCLLIQ